MGKSLEHQETGISIESSHPGCMWGILHVLHRHRWHHVRRKMIPYKRNSGSKRSTRNSEKRKGACENQDNNNNCDAAVCRISVASEKGIDPNPSTKSSMTSRIKGFISEEFCKRKGHNRSCSYPARSQLRRSDSMHHLETSGLDTLTEGASCDITPRTTQTENDNSPSVSLEMKSDHGKKPIDGDTLNQDQMKKAKELLLAYQLTNSKHSDKDFLEMFTTDKDLLRKVIENPSSPLKNFIHGRRALKSKVGLTKSMSFPVAGFPARRHSSSSEINQEHEEGTPNKEGEVRFRLH